MKTGEGKTRAPPCRCTERLAGRGVHAGDCERHLRAETRPGWAGSTSCWALGAACRTDGGVRKARGSTRPTSPTAPTPSFGSTICVTTWCSALDQQVAARPLLLHRRRSGPILIDEARTPLIISGPGERAAKTYYDFARSPAGSLRGRAKRATTIDEKKRTVAITRGFGQGGQSWHRTTSTRTSGAAGQSPHASP